MMNFPCFFKLLTLHLKYKKNKWIYCTTLNTVSIGYEFSIFRNLSLLNKAKHHEIKNCETFEIFQNFFKTFSKLFQSALAEHLGIFFRYHFCIIQQTNIQRVYYNQTSYRHRFANSKTRHFLAFFLYHLEDTIKKCRVLLVKSDGHKRFCVFLVFAVFSSEASEKNVFCQDFFRFSVFGHF